MERAGKAIWAALKQVAESERPVDFLAAVWPLVVGSRLANHTRPVAWEKTRLVIAVGDLEWQKQLERMTGELCEQINLWWGTAVVREVTFVRARGDRPAEREPQGKAPGANAAKWELGKESDSTAILKELKEPLSRIQDAELRELVSRVARKYVTRGGK